ncbi:MAG: hypothetical protein GY913_04735 [Proteobacteria bacterium]|nr:hypothetical protein [Pseudomonadota bacterium]
MVLLLACNTPPSAVGVDIEPADATTLDDLVVVVTTDAIDADDDELEYVTTWFQDGLERTDLTADTVPASETSKGEVWTVEVYATDGRDDGPTGSDDQTIANSAPTVTIDAIEPEFPLADEDVTVSWTAADDDDDALTVNVVWTLGSDSVDEDTLDAEHTTRGDVWTVTVTATDDSGATGSDSTTLDIENSPPTAEVLLAPAEPSVLDDLIASASGADPDDDPVSFTYTWTVDGAEVDVTERTFPAGLAGKGHEVAVLATPNDGFIDGEPATAAVTLVNTPPTLDGAAVSPDPVLEGSTLSCEANGYADADDEPADEPLTRWLVAGVEVSTDATITGSLYDRGQTIKCGLTPFDGEAYGDEVVSEGAVVANSPPDTSSATLTLDTTSPQEADTVAFTLSGVVDDDGDATTTSFQWWIDGVEGPTTETLTGDDFDKGDEIYVVVTISDGTDTTEITSDTATAVNTVPEITDLSFDTELYVGDTATVTLTSTDDDDDDVDYDYAWYVDGTKVGSGATFSSFEKGDELYVEVTPKDEDGSGTMWTSSTATVGNTAPEYTDVEIDTDPLYETSTCSCSGTFSDADDADSEDTASIRWLVNGTEVSTATTLDGSDFNRGDTVICALTPYDGDDYGDEVESDGIPVWNTAPDVSGASLTIDVTSPQEADSITWTLSGETDEDDDSLTTSAEWFIGGSSVSTDDELTGADFDKGDVITLVVMVSDGDDSASITASNTATAINTDPVIDSASIDEPLYPGSDATLTIDATDDDDDTLSYTVGWYVEGTWVASGTTLSSSYFVADDEVYARVKASDDETTTAATITSTVVVGNHPPGAPVVYITPAPAEEGDSLQCVIETESEDDDGDTVTYTFEWDVDGVAYTSATTTDETGDTVDGADVYDEETWTCTVTPNDGTTDGDAGEAELDIGTDCWVETYSASLASAPSGITSLSGAWGGHSYSSKDGVSCLLQTSDWNYSWIPVTRGSLDFERVEVSVYYPSTTNTSYSFYAWGQRYGYNWLDHATWFTQGTSSANIGSGNTYASSTTHTTWSGQPASTGTWVDLAFVMDHASGTLDFYIDDVLEASGMAITDTDWVDGAYVTVRSGGTAYTYSPSTCWADLAVYESTQDTTCFD